MHGFEKKHESEHVRNGKFMFLPRGESPRMPKNIFQNDSRVVQMMIEHKNVQITYRFIG